MSQAVVLGLGRLVNLEIQALCSNCSSSILQSADVKLLKSFSWDQVLQEATTYAPTLVQLLQGFTRSRQRVPSEKQQAIIGLCICILCRHRRPSMNLFQKIMSLVLYAGHSGKQVFTRLQKLLLCVSHKTTIRMLDKLGEGFDTNLLTWRDDLLPRVQTLDDGIPLAHEVNPAVLATLGDASHETNESQDSDITLQLGSDIDFDTPLKTSTPTKASADQETFEESLSRSVAAPSFSIISEPQSDDMHPSFSSTTADNQPGFSSSTYEQQHADHEASKESLSESIAAPSFSLISEPEADDMHPRSSSSPNDNQPGPSSVESVEKTKQPAKQQWSGLKIVGDNLDRSVKPRYMRSDRQTKSLHNFHVFGIRDRVDMREHSQIPRIPPSSPPLMELLPSADDHTTLRSHFAILVARMLASHMPFFSENFGDVVDQHISHTCSEEMSKKSEVVPLGVLLKNENRLEEMIEIMDHLHQYVPSVRTSENVQIPSTDEYVHTESVSLHPILFGGDQLTSKRARSSQNIRSNSTNVADCLKGLIPVTEDWHTKVYLLGVIWKRLYQVSTTQQGTLYQLRNLINRRNVGKKPKANVNAHEDFFLMIVTAHVLTAAMEFLGMHSLDDEPSPAILPEDVWMHSNDERKKILYTITGLIVSNFVDLAISFESSQPSGDEMYAYACEVIGLGLFYMEYADAIREGDATRVVRCWKYLLLLFKASGRSNYSIEAFTFLAQHQFLASPRVSQQMLWSRFVNVHGRKGKNISCDLHMEHLNRVLKTAVEGLGANKTGKALVRLGKCIAPLSEVLSQFDEEHSVRTESGRHVSPAATKDLDMIIEELMEKACTLQIMPGRRHKSFKNFSPNPIRILEYSELKEWMGQQWMRLLAGRI